MADKVVSYSADNDQKFRDALIEAQKTVGDLTVPLTLIAKDFFKSEVAIWALKGPGQYPDLSQRTLDQRHRDKQPIYPILKRSGALEKSMTDPTDPNAISEIVNGESLFIGTRVKSKKGYPYPAVHQFGSKNVPMRKFLFIGPEAPQFATSEQMGRLDRWLNILNSYVDQKLSLIGTYRSVG